MRGSRWNREGANNRRVGKGALAPCPPFLIQMRAERWARPRTHSRPVALPTLRAVRLPMAHHRFGFAGAGGVNPSLFSRSVSMMKGLFLAWTKVTGANALRDATVFGMNSSTCTLDEK